jgi:superfamily I DNA/RNA helicase
VKTIRTYGPGIDIATALAQSGVAAETIELAAAAWNEPTPYLEIFASGRTPGADDIRIDEGELATRLEQTPSHRLAALDDDDLEAVLRGTIEEWMFYLHPTQERIAYLDANGPVRVKGGPGTGKTVAALHRARHLARDERARRVLVTTFVNALPTIWDELFAAFAPDVAAKIETGTVDGIAWSIVESVDGAPKVLRSDDDRRRKLLAKSIERTPGLGDVIGGPDNLAREIDEVIAGRGLVSLEEYVPIERHGRGIGLNASQRAVVWEGYERYRSSLGDGVVDFPHLRIRALELAREGHGPRFDAVIVDEAQDLTEVHVRLLMELDTSENHRRLLLVGDGKQAIYRGGFRLLHVGLDVRGARTIQLDRNWRNTQLIAWAADGVAGAAETEDLEPDDGSPRHEAPPIRLGEPAELHVVPVTPSGDVLGMLVKDALEGVSPADIGVLARTNDGWKVAAKALRSVGVPVFRLEDLRRGSEDGVRVGTFAKSKGLEFKVVILFDVSKRGWCVTPFMLDDAADKAEWWAKERRSLFVAMTRARDRLALITTPEIGGPIAAVRDRFDEWDWR